MYMQMTNHILFNLIFAFLNFVTLLCVYFVNYCPFLFFHEITFLVHYCRCKIFGGKGKNYYDLF